MPKITTNRVRSVLDIEISRKESEIEELRLEMAKFRRDERVIYITMVTTYLADKDLTHVVGEIAKKLDTRPTIQMKVEGDKVVEECKYKWGNQVISVKQLYSIHGGWDDDESTIEFGDSVYMSSDLSCDNQADLLPDIASRYIPGIIALVNGLY
jgi:hypothetical protein